MPQMYRAVIAVPGASDPALGLRQWPRWCREIAALRWRIDAFGERRRLESARTQFDARAHSATAGEIESRGPLGLPSEVATSMKKTTINRTLKLASALIFAVAGAVGCGGDEDTGAEDPPQIAETAPVEDGEKATASCAGEMMAFCEDLNLERCEDAGCGIQVYEEQDYAMCSGERPRPCTEMESRDLCEAVRGCEWVEEE